ncbi:NTP pyrophosphohydrolase [Paenibacillus sp. Soil766]|uniref:NUDIX hydrolase n=1 Tax=Paenibacillus sp. Soil766 TaxID=1736404 RepID=UPI00070A02EA|nr:NUDIX hydrolase [Paenibacillus sp. Soil766]KRF03322.1 NTP pyrophosphohydrolase [Paenibacillus sp. Soil766]
MVENQNYIRFIREKVGNDLIFLNFSGGIIYNEKNEVLLQKRGDRNAWGFPGGAMELGESAEETAIREIFEETGLTVNVEHLIGIYTKYFEKYPNGGEAQTISFFFQCKPVSGELIADGTESLEVRYFSVEDFPPLFNKQHEDALKDWIANKLGNFR